MIVLLLLLAAVLIVYSPVKDWEFLWDDEPYIRTNPWIRLGLTWESFKWAITSFDVAVWIPLTWLSFMLDYQLFGLNPAGYHLHNLVLHLANVLLLYGVLFSMTRAFWRSALVASLFALHPLNVESVAWVAERKNVLSTFFGLLTIAAYLRYVKKPTWLHYGLVLALLSLSLMAKQMLVTLPCVLLLLDYWPLERFGKSAIEFRKRLPRLVVEKLPLLAVSIFASLLAILSAKTILPSLTSLTLGSRLANGVVASADYLKKIFWPVDLAAFYPHPRDSLSLLTVVLSAFVLTAISVGVWWFRGHRYLTVGWLWYLGILFPVNGLIQVGAQSMADRHTYVPAIGIFIMLVWTGASISERLEIRERWLAAAVPIFAVLMILTQQQVFYWRDTLTVFEHTVRLTERNAMAHNNLGSVLVDRGRIDDALDHFSRALEIEPFKSDTLYNMGLALKLKGSHEEAFRYFQMALKADPSRVEVHNTIGLLLLSQEKVDEAVAILSTAAQINPRVAEVHNTLGSAFASQGRMDEAIRHFREALELDPWLAKTYNNLGAALDLQGKREEALQYYRRGIELDPHLRLIHNNIGKMLMEQGELEQAAQHFLKAIQVEPDLADAYFNLGLVRLRQERISEAIECFRQVLDREPQHREAQEQLANLLTA